MHTSPYPTDIRRQRRVVPRFGQRGSDNHPHTSNSTQDELTDVKKWIMNLDNLFVTFTVLAVILGMTIGLLVKIYASPSPRTIYLLSFPGELLMNMLKMLIIPLIVSSLIAG
ncbi:unnamed protein product [Schistosoma mattheei]|uniref:Amino acid transporter n=1 Tax=Schistosoma mattheei TaxID=31246 RepID=A0A183Q5X4_9TREM|nr:unnamed protein product [Schistosoma mattheei]